eukprot:4301483-Amphidinium_carterae.1
MHDCVRIPERYRTYIRISATIAVLTAYPTCFTSLAAACAGTCRRRPQKCSCHQRSRAVTKGSEAHK